MRTITKPNDALPKSISKQLIPYGLPKPKDAD